MFKNPEQSKIEIQEKTELTPKELKLELESLISELNLVIDKAAQTSQAEHFTKADELQKEIEEKTKVLEKRLLPEFIRKFDIKSLEYLNKLLDEKEVDIDFIASGLAGLDSPEAWELRKKLIQKGADKNHIVLGLAGLNSKQAWEMRNLANSSNGAPFILLSLAGLDSDRAWEMREELMSDKRSEKGGRRGRRITKNISKKDIAQSLTGLNSDRAWEMRDELFTTGTDEEKNDIVMSLAGLDSDRAWKMRDELFTTGTNEDRFGYIARSLSCLDSDRAWKMRWKLSITGDIDDIIVSGLVGIDSPEAWGLRERLLFDKIEVDKNFIAISLAGLYSNKAWEAREKLFNEGFKNFVAVSMSGNYITFIWRLKALGKIKSAH